MDAEARLGFTTRLVEASRPNWEQLLQTRDVVLDDPCRCGQVPREAHFAAGVVMDFFGVQLFLVLSSNTTETMAALTASSRFSHCDGCPTVEVTKSADDAALTFHGTVERLSTTAPRVADSFLSALEELGMETSLGRRGGEGNTVAIAKHFGSESLGGPLRRQYQEPWSCRTPQRRRSALQLTALRAGGHSVR